MTAATEAHAPDSKLRQAVTGPLLYLFILGDVHGAGIYALMGVPPLTMIMANRLAFGMAEQGLLPAVLGRTPPRRRTPWVAIVATTIVSILLTLIGDLSLRASTVVLLLLFVFIAVNVSVLVLRRRPVEHQHFRVWTFVPVLGVASRVLLSQQSPPVWLGGAIALAVGVALYLGAQAVRGGSQH